MNSPLLVRHPPPHSTESLPGYLLRLCEVNGYASLRSLFQLAEMKQTESSWTNLNCTKLARIANCSITDLDRISFKQRGDNFNKLWLLKNQILERDLHITSAKICPECVVERGFIEAHWHIKLMIACPIHERAAVWFCGKCRQRIPAKRIGLLTCKCGGPLDNHSGASVSNSALWLLDLIRCKAIGSPKQRRNETRMPERQLSALSLASLLSLVQYLGKHRMNASANHKPRFGKEPLEAAASVLTDWPCNFERMLMDICPWGPLGLALTVEDDFMKIFKVVFERRPD